MAQEEPKQTEIATDCENGQKKNQWTVEEKRALAAITFPLIEMQKAYGRQMDAKLVMQGWEIKFAGRFTIEQILFALNVYTDKHDDFPAPANIVAILEPEEPKVTTAEFIAAQDWQKRNNYPMISDAKDTIEKYHEQQRESREKHEITCDKVLAIAKSAVKPMIEQKQSEGAE